MESDSQLSEQEFHEMEKASTIILDVLRRARSRPARPVHHHQSEHVNNNYVNPPAPIPTTTLNSSPNLMTQPMGSLLQNHQQLQQLQQVLRDSQLSQRAMQGNLMGTHGLGQPQFNNAQLNALLLSAAAQRQQVFGQLPQPNNVAATVLSNLATTLQQQHGLGVPTSLLSTSQPNQLHQAVSSQLHQTAVVQPQPQISQAMMPNQNSRMEELVCKAMIEWDAQRRSNCARCHRKDPVVKTDQPTSWVECRPCSLKYHSQCAPDQCEKCKHPVA